MSRLIQIRVSDDFLAVEGIEGVPRNLVLAAGCFEMAKVAAVELVRGELSKAVQPAVMLPKGLVPQG